MGNKSLLIKLGICVSFAGLLGTVQLVYGVGNGEESEPEEGGRAAKDQRKGRVARFAKETEGETIGGLPDELWQHAFQVGKLSYEDMQKGGLVCKKLYVLVGGEGAWDRRVLEILRRHEREDKGEVDPFGLHEIPVLTVTPSEVLTLARYGDGVRGLRVVNHKRRHRDELPAYEIAEALSSFSRLQVLDLRKCFGITDEVIPHLPKDLRVLRVDDSFVTDKLGEYLKGAEHLVELSLCDTSITEKIISCVPKGLRKLSLGGTRGITISDSTLSEYLRGAQGLEELRLQYVLEITSAGLEDLPKGLKKLSLQSCFGVSDGMEAPLEGLFGLEELNFIGVLAKDAVFSHLPKNLSALYGSSLYESYASLREYLESAGNIEKLGLHGFYLPEGSHLDYLPVGLKTLSLETFNCSNNIGEYLKQSPHLESVRLGGSTITGDIIRQLPIGLSSLVLRDVAVTDGAMIEYLKKADRLKVLVLTGPDITENVLNYLPNGLKELDIRGNGLTAEIVGRFPEGLRKLIVDCDGFEFTEEILEHFPKGLASLTLKNATMTDGMFKILGVRGDLDSLNIECCSIPDTGLQYLPQGLRKLSISHNAGTAFVNDLAVASLPRGLQELILRNANITDSGLEYLKQLNSLRKVTISWCSQITEEGIRSLREAMSLAKVYYTK